MSKPYIGIIEWPYTDKDGDVIYEVFNDVVNWVIKAGGIPVGIFPSQIEDYINKRVSEVRTMTVDEASDLFSSIDRCDAIIKPGAIKIYSHERLIHRYTVDRNMPYLGICAGMQIVAAYGKPEIKNIKNETNINHHQPGYSHDVYVKENTLLSKIVDTDKFKVYSRHRYHIADEGVNRISAVAEDNIIEAIENPKCDYNLGVQWHPELAPFTDKNSQNLFESLVEEAKIYSKIKR